MGESEFILVLMEKMNGKLFLDQFIRTFGSTWFYTSLNPAFFIVVTAIFHFSLVKRTCSVQILQMYLYWIKFVLDG